MMQSELVEQATEASELDPKPRGAPSKTQVIPPSRVRYLAEIAEAIEEYDKWADEQSAIARKLYQLQGVIEMVEKPEEN